MGPFDGGGLSGAVVVLLAQEAVRDAVERRLGGTSMKYRVKVKITGRAGSFHAFAWDVAWRMVDSNAFPFGGVTATWAWQS